jgi:hypothetical protein
MKIKFKYGIKSFSGLFDEMIFANYERDKVVIGRMYNPSPRVTENNTLMGTIMQNITKLWAASSETYKKDCKNYAYKMFGLPMFDGKISGNGFSVFVKILWAASKDTENPLDLMALSVDDLEVEAYSQIESVKVCVENGYLPVVDGYEAYNSKIV